mmetsp:Transcript_23241/g.35936  ORF Transcript_23241/g.35936 Transcript_23241/m.35936 type:complete len:127 (-) Transcript_23241:67-447(-)
MFAQEQQKLEDASRKEPEEIFIPPPLTGWIDDVSTLGRVDISFSHPLDKALFKPEFISDRTLSVSIEAREDNVEPNVMTWELVSLSDSGMQIQLGFDNAILVSSGEERDVLQVEFETNLLFRSFEY